MRHGSAIPVPPHPPPRRLPPTPRPPPAGKSVFLQALSGRLQGGSTRVTGSVRYNGVEPDQFDLTRTVALVGQVRCAVPAGWGTRCWHLEAARTWARRRRVPGAHPQPGPTLPHPTAPQYDHHIPSMTVLETHDFAWECQNSMEARARSMAALQVVRCARWGAGALGAAGGAAERGQHSAVHRSSPHPHACYGPQPIISAGGEAGAGCRAGGHGGGADRHGWGGQQGRVCVGRRRERGRRPGRQGTVERWQAAPQRLPSGADEVRGTVGWPWLCRTRQPRKGGTHPPHFAPPCPDLPCRPAGS